MKPSRSLSFGLLGLLASAVHSAAQTDDALRVRGEFVSPPNEIISREDPAPVDLFAVPLLSTATVGTQYLEPLKITDSGFVLLRNTRMTPYAYGAGSDAASAIPAQAGYRWRGGRYTPLNRYLGSDAPAVPLLDEGDFSTYGHFHLAGVVRVADINESGAVAGMMGADLNISSWFRSHDYFEGLAVWPAGVSSPASLPVPAPIIRMEATDRVAYRRFAGSTYTGFDLYSYHWTGPGGAMPAYRRPDALARGPWISNNGVVHAGYSNRGYFIPGVSVPGGAGAPELDPMESSAYVRTGRPPLAASAVVEKFPIAASQDGKSVVLQDGLPFPSSYSVTEPVQRLGNQVLAVPAGGGLTNAGRYLAGVALGWTEPYLSEPVLLEQEPRFIPRAISSRQEILSINADGAPVIWRCLGLTPGTGEPANVSYRQLDTRLHLPPGWGLDELAPSMNAGRQLVGTLRRTEVSPLQPTAPMVAVPAGLWTDLDRNGQIDVGYAVDYTTAETPFRFASNDDDDNPGATFQADYLNNVVDGPDDLADFFPVLLEIKQLLTVLPPGTMVKYKLKQADGKLNFVYTSLTRATAFNYQNVTTATTGYGPNANQAAAVATTQQITAAGVELPAAFLTRIKDEDQGVILVELRGMTSAPLKLVVEKDNVQIAEVALHIATGEIKWESLHANNPVEDFKVPEYYLEYTTKDLKWLEGKRYFTDGDGPNATFHRARINVKVLMAGAAGKTVKLKAFDVDDPTPPEWDPANIIDPNDTNGPAGNDNNYGLDATNGSYSPIFGTFYGPSNPVYADTINVTLDAQGEAVVGFNFSAKPGANYRIAAILNESASQLDAFQVTNATAPRYVAPDAEPVQGFAGIMSPTLTTWRKLHVEIDSMATIPTAANSSQKNYTTGIIVAEHTLGGPFVSLDLSNSLSDWSRYTDQGSHIEIDGVGTYTAFFEAVDADTVKFYVPGGISSSAVGRTYKIYDDDFEVIPLPLNSIAGPVIDRLKAYYAPAFIEARPAENPDTIVGFVLNQSVPGFNPELFGNVTWNDAKNIQDKAYYWQHLVTLGYQSDTSHDHDPAGEKIDFGLTLKGGIWGRYSAIYPEAIRDSDKMTPNNTRSTSMEAQVEFIDWVAIIIAHEIGHAPGNKSEDGDHNEGGIMTATGLSNITESFSADSILRFRTTNTWSRP